MSKLTHLLTECVSEYREQFICDQGTWHSTKDVQSDIARVQSILQKSGVRPGQVTVLAYPNSYMYTVVYLAALQYGAVIAPVNPEMPKAELQAFLENSRAVAGFFLEKHVPALTQLCDADSAIPDFHTAFVTRLPAVQRVDSPLQPAASSNVATVTRFETNELPIQIFGCRDGIWKELHLPDTPVSLKSLESPREDAIGVLLFTSGTTGRPKAVGIRHVQLLATARNVVAAHGLSADDVSYCFLPLFHINAQVVALLSTWLSGGRVVLAPKFSASQFWPAVVKYGITWASAVPTVIAILTKIQVPNPLPRHLRFVRSASAQLPVLHARRFERHTGVPVIESYGMTEAASQICVNPLPPLERRLGSVGKPYGVELQVVDESDCPVPTCRTGEIVIRGESVITSYEQAESQKDFRNGWFHTGDIGYIDEDGYVYLTGRKKELINRAGEKISPYEVEDVIREHPSVSQVAVIGLPDALYGKRIAAYIVPTRPVSNQTTFTEGIFAQCSQMLSHYKCPSEVHIVTELPIGPTGKIQRHLLKQRVVAESLPG